MRHYTDANGRPYTPAAHTGVRTHITAKMRTRNPDVVLAFGQDGRLFRGDTEEDYDGATVLSCYNCARFAVAESLGIGVHADGCVCGNIVEPLGDHEACEEWERRT